MKILKIKYNFSSSKSSIVLAKINQICKYIMIYYLVLSIYKYCGRIIFLGGADRAIKGLVLI